MPWARMDDGWHDHPKVDTISLAAAGLWAKNFTWAYRHRKTAPLPGFVPEKRVRTLAGKQYDALVKELTTPPIGYKHALWEPVEGGWIFHDFEDYLPKDRDPAERAEAGRKGGQARWAPPEATLREVPGN